MAYSYRGNSKFDSNDYGGAIEDHDHAILLNPKSAWSYNCRGLAKRATKDFDGAIRDFDETIRLDPTYLAAYSNRASTKNMQGDHAGAIRDYDELIQRNPKTAHNYNSRGWAKHLNQDYAGAIQDYDEVTRLDSTFISSWSNKAFLFSTCPEEKYRDPAKALECAEKAVQLNPKNGWALSAKACAQAARGKYLDAVAAQKQALEFADYAKDDAIDGGVHASARLAAWERGELWLAKTPEKE